MIIILQTNIMINEEMLKQIEIILEERLGKTVKALRASGIGGGCINDAHRLDTSEGSFFVKHNDARRYPGMFVAEAKGLQLLKNSQTVYVPDVIGHGESGADSFLVLEYISPGNEQSDFWEHFGRKLAHMHQQSMALDITIAGSSMETNTEEDTEPDGKNKRNKAKNNIVFGLDHNNYIGSLPQSNAIHHEWIDFFIAERLEAQLKMARDDGKAGKELTGMFRKLYRHLPDFFPEEPPALLHGDLWSGNYMCGNDGRAAIIDPAVYYGHRYMDLGMSKLFGGFMSVFYESYNDAYPLEPSWHQSIDIANLYPLMVHVNLFGGGYLNSVKSILRRFS
jgi:protein-ribulosamine 3-kinase